MFRRNSEEKPHFYGDAETSKKTDNATSSLILKGAPCVTINVITEEHWNSAFLTRSRSPERGKRRLLRGIRLSAGALASEGTSKIYSGYQTLLVPRSNMGDGGRGGRGGCPSPSIQKLIPSPRAKNQGPSKKMGWEKGKFIFL